MKGKFLIYAGLLAAAVGCTKESLVSEGTKNDGGITFSASLAEGVATKGDVTYDDITKKNKFSWTAEWDRINVYSDAVAGAAENTSLGVVTDWTDDLSAAVYKATQSAGLGQFTAINDQNMLKFDSDSDNSNFVATYNAELKEVALDEEEEDENVITGLTLDLKLNLTAQTVGNYDETGAGYTASFPMYSKTNAGPETGKSVGEKVKLEFLRVLPGLAFSTEGVTSNMSNTFGSLTSITVENKGTMTVDDGDPKGETTKSSNEASIHNLAFNGSTNAATVTVDFTGAETAYTFDKGSADMSATATMTYSIDKGIQTKFLDGKRAYMVIAPVEREGKTETVLITYTYKNIILKQVHKTSADWVVKPGNENGFYVIPAFNVAKEYPYLMVQNYGGASTDYTLILNSGKLADTFAEDSRGVEWNGETKPWANIKKIESNVELGSELSLLAKFTGLKEVILNKDKSIPAGTFTKDQAGQMITLDMPLVTSIDQKFTALAFESLKTLKLASYTFTDDKVNKLLNMNSPMITKSNNDSVVNPLEVIDMSAVEDMMPYFGVDRSLSFKDYKNLKTVTVKKDGVHLSPSAFSGCVNLATVNGVVDITDAVSGFEGTSNLGKVFNKPIGVLNITGTEIPESAFKGSSIKNIYKDNKQVVPTSIGTSAFEDATEIEKMDLSAATEIGADAFRKAINFVGVASGEIFTVGATKILGGTFAYTKLDGAMIEFSNATYIEPGILFGVSGQIKQIKFAKVLKDLPAQNVWQKNNVNNRQYTWANTFGETKNENIDLFVNPAQTEYVNGTSLVFVKTAATTSAAAETVAVKFKSLQKRQ